MNNTKVRDAVGNTSDAIKFAEDAAGEENINIKHINISKPVNPSIVLEMRSKMPDEQSILI
jgi:hypothetical protein